MISSWTLPSQVSRRWRSLNQLNVPGGEYWRLFKQIAERVGGANCDKPPMVDDIEFRQSAQVRDPLRGGPGVNRKASTNLDVRHGF